MNQILDYDALFNERGEQVNICTAADVGGSYTSGRESGVDLPVFTRQTPVIERTARDVAPKKSNPPCADPYPYRLRAVRYVDFDTFVKPERSEEEAKDCLQKTALLFGSIITAIVAIAILL